MKILTIAPSPYLLTKEGKIHRSIINHFKESGHDIKSIVFDHDISIFAPEEDDKYFLENESGEKVSEIIPLPRPTPSPTSQVIVHMFDIVEAEKPDVVISIGDCDETDCVGSIKEVLPESFRWIAILSIDNKRNELFNKYLDPYEKADKIVVMNKAALYSLNDRFLDKVKHVPFGPSDSFINLQKAEDGMKKMGFDPIAEKTQFISMAKNSSACNLMAYYNACSGLGNYIGNYYLHSNIDDPGEFDLDECRKILDSAMQPIEINFPETYSSIYDSISEEDLNIKLNSMDVIVDVPVRSATGLHVLEAMRCGCIPLLTPVGALDDILFCIGEEYGSFWDVREALQVKSCFYTTGTGEVSCIADENDLLNKMRYLSSMKKESKEKFNKLRDVCLKVAKKFSQKDFLDYLETTLYRSENEVDTLKLD